MTPSEFIAKWRRVELTERSASQQHFLDLCEMLGHPKPAEADPTGESFTFEKGAAKHGGGEGWADVWKAGCFAWEYKGKHKNLDAAYDQILRYREDLGNPPLLVVCDMDRIVVRTNFTNTRTKRHEIPLAELGTKPNLDILHALFNDPEKLRPNVERELITQKAAAKLADVAQRMRDRGLDPHTVARFLDRVVFCLFAEDVGLLPAGIFSKAIETCRHRPERFAKLVGQIFHEMATGGDYGSDEIRHFDGHLFDDVEVLILTNHEIQVIREAAALDWSAIEPSILGTLFERGLDPGRRSQLGAHYTSREDIELLVEPVVMIPLRREWEETRSVVESLLENGTKQPGQTPPKQTNGTRERARQEADVILQRFVERLTHVTVLDPACGSGNFLFVTLQMLKDLEKQVVDFALSKDLGVLSNEVGPWQLHGIEVNPYAHELAQLTVWLGYLQWVRDHGHPFADSPVLRPMTNFHLMDAIVDLSDPANPREPEWPAVDFIVGNPPFLGGKLLRTVLGDDHVERMFALWRDRVKPESDLCCYWFEMARRQIEQGRCKRAGLLATQGIRGGASRNVLKRIQESGGIFYAVSDRNWVLDGANVHVSMVAFDGGIEQSRTLDRQPVDAIHANLSSATDISQAETIAANLGIAFMGDTKGGAFDIDEGTARAMLGEPNPHGRPNSDVLTPWVNGMDVTRRSRGMWIVDFGSSMSEADAALYEKPFGLVSERVRPQREANKRESYRRLWWRHVEGRPAMNNALGVPPRFLATLTLAKHRIFAWMAAPTLPDHQLIVFARSDDYFLGVLHSRIHEKWALKLGTQLEDRPRYTPTTCFETFPFPDPTPEQEAAIGEAAKELDTLRCAWLNPPEWTREEVLEFAGSVDGPWARYIHEPNEKGIGTVRWPRTVPRDPECAAKLAKRTLTNLYNARPGWLDLAHRRLDEAVSAAYGWPVDLTDDEILARLLDLNLSRSETL